MRKLTLFLLVSCILLSVSITQASVNSRGFLNVVINDEREIGFQNSLTHYVLLQVTNGTLNSSRSEIRIFGGGGHFIFNSSTINTFEVVTNVSNVKVSGDSGRDLRFVENGTAITANALDRVVVLWSISMEPFLPVMFLFGMVGMCSMFGGMLYPALLIKRKEYVQALKTFLIFFFLGLGLFMAWVFL